MKKEYLQKIVGDCFIFESENASISINCYSKSNRNGFKHYTDFILINIGDSYVYPLDAEGRKELKVQYYNRTWEMYQYQSLLLDVLTWLHKKNYICDDDYAKFKNEARYH